MREKLTAEFCANSKKPGYYGDGGGLYLAVKPDGRKYWCFRWRDRHVQYTTAKSAGVGKLREKGLGRYGEYDVSLKQARALAAECRQLVRQGKDPIANALGKLSFGECVDRYINVHETTWHSTKQAVQWSSSLKTHAAPLMNLPVSDVDSALVLSCLEPIWTSKTETATRVRQRIESVLGWAIDLGYSSGENPARWRGNLDKLLPMPTKLKKSRRLAGLDYRNVGPFMAKLAKVDSMAARALELQILTATRPGEAVGARWPEFGLRGEIWTIPAARTQTGRDHTVPLSPRVVALLNGLPRSSEYVFPGRSGDRGMTTAAGMKLLKALQPGITQQGFRSTFHEWAVNQTAYPDEVIEFAMGSQSGEEAEAAHFRSDLIAKRAKMMRDWADFCDEGAGN